MIQLLTEQGADLTQLSLNKKPLLEIARESEDNPIIDYLEKLRITLSTE